MRLMTTNRALELCAQMNYETEILDIFDQAPRGSVVWDLGACEGRFSVYAALSGLKVIAIEPEKRNFNALLENRRLNDIQKSDMQCFNVAVGDRNDVMELNVGQPWEGGHQKVLNYPETRSDLGFEVKERQTVSVVRLDDFAEENKLELPHTLKVDIDGAEAAFLSGAEQSLSAGKIEQLVIELQEQDSAFPSLVSRIEEFGYRQAERTAIPNEPGLWNILFVKV